MCLLEHPEIRSWCSELVALIGKIKIGKLWMWILNIESSRSVFFDDVVILLGKIKIETSGLSVSL